MSFCNYYRIIMSDIVIHVENLGKRYRIGERHRYKALRDTLTNALYAPVRAATSLFNGHYTNASNNNGDNHFWSLKDVSFDIKQGEAIGVIGRNGAGKSTLLKILSRITKPTEGYVRIRGRVGSLLEVGTGFHPELTGRENAYLNGAIIGMKKKEIDRKFDEIVAFSEIEKFIDTAVKFYSSGMYIRLAFAVAAHLEPEVLIVDEVLAVGDAAFQKKCLGKMGNVASAGRTVVFVSHQMNQIRRLCQKCIWLDSGRLQKMGPAVEAVGAYEAAVASPLESVHRGNDEHVAARFFKWEIVEPHHEQSNVLATLGPVTLRFILKVNKPIYNGHHGIALFNSDNQLMWATAVNHLDLNLGIREFVYTLPGLPLRPGIYYWQISLYSDGRLADFWHCVPEMVIGTEPVTHPLDKFQGVLNLPWQFAVR
jgi:ABC-type polysaccharide/polyol phosphate transport system ATPase subunit